MPSMTGPASRPIDKAKRQLAVINNDIESAYRDYDQLYSLTSRLETIISQLDYNVKQRTRDLAELSRKVKAARDSYDTVAKNMFKLQGYVAQGGGNRPLDKAKRQLAVLRVEVERRRNYYTTIYKTETDLQSDLQDEKRALRKAQERHKYLQPQLQKAYDRRKDLSGKYRRLKQYIAQNGG